MSFPGPRRPRSLARPRVGRPLAVAVATAVLAPLVLLAGCEKPPSPCPWVGSTEPVANRVDQVVGRMTRAEKLSLVHGTQQGVSTASGYAGTVEGIPRLCIPPLHLSDGPAGVGTFMRDVTQLPAPLALAAGWDPDRSRRYGEVLGAEMRAKGASVALAPTINIYRDPRWGRGFETFGEDPYLTAALSTPEIVGIQDQRVIAQVKHLAVYNQETGRDGPDDDALVDERTLREIYLPAFESAIRTGHAGSVMCSYNWVNGAPACANRHLLDQVLKGEWGFSGFVTTDWWVGLGGPAAATAGLDMQMPDGCFFGPALSDAIDRGEVAATRLDDMARRVLRPMFAFGIVDHPPTGTTADAASTPDHVDLARAVAAQGTVLLRNQGLLPLDPDAEATIAVIGRDAGPAFSATGGGSAVVTATDLVTPLRAITERAGPGAHVVFDDGTDVDRAAAVAADADVALVFAGRDDTESHDHTTVGLADRDDRLVDAVAGAQPRTGVVLNTGGPVAMPWLDRTAAVVENWHSGQQGGRAVADVLFGDVNPSGKLPVTFPRSLGDLPTAAPERFPGTDGGVRYDEGLLVGYRWYQATGTAPLFPFGFGLSYTSFAFDDLRVSAPTADGTVAVSARVTNTGTRAGTEVAQLYLSAPASAGEPPAQLRGFQRVALDPGASATVRFTLDARALSHWDDRTRRWVATPGTYRVLLGNSSADLPLQGELTVDAPVATTPPAALADNAQPPPQLEAAARCPQDVIAPKANELSTYPVTP